MFFLDLGFFLDLDLLCISFFLHC